MGRKKVHVPEYDYYRHEGEKLSGAKKYDKEVKKNAKRYDKSVGK
jgi:hypothetical protein